MARSPVSMSVKEQATPKGTFTLTLEKKPAGPTIAMRVDIEKVSTIAVAVLATAKKAFDVTEKSTTNRASQLRTSLPVPR